MNSIESITTSALHGKTLYGDNFNAEQIAEWFADEVSGYSGLDHKDSSAPMHLYAALDDSFAWKNLRGQSLSALGIGSAWGLEFEMISSRLRQITILEPSPKFWSNAICGVPAKYVSPSSSGVIAFPDETFDFATAFGVLHHIPNVKKVLSEIHRVTKVHGQVFVREPITSMGDWRFPRRGLTKRERGLPLDYIPGLCSELGFELEYHSAVGFAPILKASNLLGVDAPWNSKVFTTLDYYLSKAFLWNWTYHRESILRRFAPSIGCWVLRRVR